MSSLVVSLLVVTVLAPTGQQATDVGKPSLAVDGSQVVLSGLPDVLGDEDVRPHLTKGLTTTVYVSVEVRPSGGRGAREQGGARLEVRYDLWDEVFLVHLTDASGVRPPEKLAGFDALVEWWTGLELAVLDAKKRPPGEAKVEVLVIPFSEREKNDAQRWFARSLQRAGRSRSSLEAPSDDSVRTLSNTFHLLMATSIQRQALATRRYTLAMPANP